MEEQIDGVRGREREGEQNKQKKTRGQSQLEDH
jgi:hypothetical protein